MPKLTKRFVESTEIKEKPYFIFDDIIPGFSICISPKGKRHYCFQYTKNKRTKRMWLGLHGVMTAEQARTEAVAKLSEVKAGGDPHQKKMEQNREPLLQDVVKRFVDEHVNLYCKVSTQEGYMRFLDKHILPRFGNYRISEINSSDVASLHLSLRDTSYKANRCIAVLSKLFSFAEKLGLRPNGSNPCGYLEKFPEKSRCRYLTEEETARLAKALDELKQYPDENLAAIYCIKLLLFTGCRRNEIKTLKWEYVDYEKKLLRLPDSKTGAKIVYAGGVVMNLLEEIKSHPRYPQGNPYVIWGQKPNTCLHNIQKPWERFCKLANISDARIHDLRHSFASFMVNEGTSLAMIAKLLGHSQVQTTERYSHIMAAPLIATTERITEKLGLLFNITERTQTKPAKHDVAIKGTTIRAPVYLTSTQAAEYLNIKRSLIESWRYQKTGPSFIKVGNCIRYRLDALEEFLNAKEKECKC